MNFEKFYNSLKIGDKIHVINSLNPNKSADGVLMDKYLMDDNVLADILMDNGVVVERAAFFRGTQQMIHVVDAV